MEKKKIFSKKWNRTQLIYNGKYRKKLTKKRFTEQRNILATRVAYE